MAAKKATKKSAGIRKKKASSRKTMPAQAVADAPAGSRVSSSARWTFLTTHPHVLVLLNTDEPPVLRDVATRVGITERAVQRIILDLEEGGFIERERVGRRNRYRVLRDQELRHPIESHRTIGDLLKLVSHQ